MSAPDFPCGLIQPAGSFRFSADALLLASFADGGGAGLAADLGAGCGAAAFGLALRFPELSCAGIDREDALVEAARANAAALGLGGRVSFISGDVNDERALAILGRGSCGLVIANPPYRVTGAGRASASTLRRRALEGPPGAAEDFARAAAFLLRGRGRFVCVCPPARLEATLAALGAARLAPRRLRCVHPRPGKAAVLMLLEARKDVRSDLIVETPLVLHAAAGGGRLSPEAAAFCPWLRRRTEQGRRGSGKQRREPD